MLHARDRMEQHDAPLLITESGQRLLQQNALIGIQSALLRGNSVLFLFTACGIFLFAPQTHQAQVAAHGQQPAHG